MKKICLGLFLLLLVHGVPAQQRADTADSIKSWLTFLASDEMKGRANGSEEIEKVARWLSIKYGQYGLQNIGNLKDFVQPYILNEGSSFIHKNIVGYIPAKEEDNNNSPNPYIVLSAHFDHVGMSRFPVDGDSIFNGADDNATGVVAMLAIAKNLYEQNLQPDCHIVFAAFSNEERGMRGSRYFCSSEVIPVQEIKVNMNLEMLGRTEEFGRNRYYITGPKHSNFQDVVEDFNWNKEWEIADAGGIVDMLFRMSDNYSFVSHASRSDTCVPAHTIATSVGMEHIHRVSDEIEYIDFENMNNLVEYLTQLVIFVSGKNVEIKCM